MNKWQIICPLVLVLVLGMWAVRNHSQNHASGTRNAIERHLQSILAEFEKHQGSGRFPTLEAARTILNSKEAEMSLHHTSLFTTRDLLYSTAQPAVGSEAVVLCAYVGETLYGIRANRVVSEVPAGDPQLVDFVKLVKIEDFTETRSVGVSNR